MWSKNELSILHKYLELNNNNRGYEFYLSLSKF